MHAVQVPHRGVDQRLERSRRKALEDTRHQEARVLVARSAAPCRSDGQKDRPDDKHVPLAPDAARRHDDEGGDAHAQQVPARQLGDTGKGDDKVEGQGERVGGEDGAERGRKDGG